MGAGGGGMAIAAQYMKQLDRRIQRRIQETRDRARTRHIITKLAIGPSSRDDFEFACYHLCGNCGFMTYRPSGPCTACGKQAWVNLQSKTVAYDLHHLEQADRQRTFFTGRNLIFLFGIYEAILLLTLLGMRIPDFPQQLGAILFSLMLLPLVIYLLRRPITWIFLWMTKKEAVIRWRMPVRKISDKEQSIQTLVGTAQGGQPMPSPLGLAPCLAYQIAVRFDVAGDARPPQWILEEADNTAFEFKDSKGRTIDIPAFSILFEDKLLPIETKTLEANHINLSEFLHQRGLFLEDGTFEFFYAQLLPDSPIEATLYPGKIAVKTVGESESDTH